MNATETIQAAIDRLEGLRNANADYGAWVAEPGLPTRRITAKGDTWVADVRSRWDTELIVTLHRTIDAQLSILRETHAARSNLVILGVDEEWTATRDAEYAAIYPNEIDLAEAIFGGAK